MRTSRIDRVAELIKEEIGEILDRLVRDPAIPEMVTVHSVRISKDLRVADVNVTFLDDEDPKRVQRAMAALGEAAGFIRAELGRRVRIKYLPELRFHYNPSTRYALGLDRLFKEIQAAPPPGSEAKETDSAS